MKKGTLTKWMAALCSALLMISLFAIPAFADDTTPESPNKVNWGLIIGIIVAVAVVAVAVVLCIKFREKIAKFLRVYKREFKNVTWFSWKQTLKSSCVVVIVLAIFAAVICLLDIGLNKGILAFINLF